MGHVSVRTTLHRLSNEKAGGDHFQGGVKIKRIFLKSPRGEAARRASLAETLSHAEWAWSVSHLSDKIRPGRWIKLTSEMGLKNQYQV